MGELRKKTKSALVWNTVNQFGRYGFRFIVTVILARLLTPNDFGLIAMILVITSFSELFISSGFHIGIVQRKELNDVELSSVFYLNIFVGLFFTVVVYLIAPWIASIYGNPQVTPLTRVLSIVYLFKSLAIVQQGLINREMEFRKLTISMVSAQLLAGVLAIGAALIGWGVWSLIINLVLEAFFVSVLFWIQNPWRPKRAFQMKSLKPLWNFSSKLLLQSFLVNLGNRVDLFFIGKIFSSTITGLYSKTKDFALLPARIGSQVITISFFPVFAKLQDESKSFNRSYKQLYKLLIFIFAPVFGLIFICAHQLVLILLGPKWINGIVYFKWATIIGFFYVINSLMNYVINSKGRSDLNLKRSLIHMPLRIGLFIAIPFVFDDFTPLYYIFVYIAFFLSANVFNNYFISRITGMVFWKNILTGIEYIVLTIILILCISYLDISQYFDNLYFQVIFMGCLLVIGYYSILALTCNELFLWTVKKLDRKFR